MARVVGAFHPFSQQHLYTVVVGCAVLGVLLVAGKRGGNSRLLATGVLAFCNLSAYPLNLAAWLALDAPKSLDNLLPLQLCDLTAIIAGFALLTRCKLACALTYFWGLAATLQALVTPAITVAFPSPPNVMFFVQHFAVVGAAVFLPLIDGWRPRQPLWLGPLEAFGWALVYLLMVLGVNHWLGTNFGFTLRPPDNPSLIDHLGPWPWYLLVLMGIGLAVFFLLVVPFRRRGAVNDLVNGQSGVITSGDEHSRQ
jgi:hypothetical integral membrane protein (TIGR02206 family)